MKKKVLIIEENSTVPLDPRVWNEACALRNNGYSVTVLCPCDKGGYDRHHEVIDGVHVYRHPATKEGNTPLTYIWEYSAAFFWEFLYSWWIYLRRGFDVIQGCNPPDDLFLVALPFKLLGVKYIFDQHDLNPELYIAKYETQGFFYNLLIRLERLTYRFSDVVIVTNESYREVAMARGDVDPKDVFIVRNGPKLENFQGATENTSLKYGKPFLVGYVGNISIQEGLDILLDVAAHIKDLGRCDIHFTCVGGGPSVPGLRKMVEDKGLGEMVNFTGRVPDAELFEILSTADVCVNPDKPCEMNDKSTMIKIMEYMAFAKPIVQFDLKEGRFSAGEASLYADNNNQVADFAAKLLWLLDNPDKRKGMGQFGRKKVEEELCWKYSVFNLLAAYRRCFDKTTRSALIPPKFAAKDTSRDADLNEKTTMCPRIDLNGSRRRERAKLIQGSAGRLLAEHFRCSEEELATLTCPDSLTGAPGYFNFGPEAICYGNCSSGFPSMNVHTALHDASRHAQIMQSTVTLTFDPAQVVDNLRFERYLAQTGDRDLSLPANRVFRSLYYKLRPALPVSARKHLQRLYFHRRIHTSFPSWPLDSCVESIMERLLILSMKAHGIKRMPFVWFWPDGALSCTILTHDVETSRGVTGCRDLMDLADRFEIKSSFQFVPEGRYSVPDGLLCEIRDRGFEVNLHDLNHDGRLFFDHEEFLNRAKRINKYARQFNALGFRSAVMYRNADWLSALDVSYDMSIPNAAHLDPQKGGCCTIFPFFIGKLVELPLTTTQDYSLFHILNDFSIQLWKQQISLIRERNGLLSFIVHPDYVNTKATRRVYLDLLDAVSELRAQGKTWITLPREAAAWWRLRSELKLVRVDDLWRIEGAGRERATIAYAELENDTLRYSFASNHIPVTAQGS